MSGFNYTIYSGLGMTLVLLSVWRLAAGTKAGPLKLTGLLLGVLILTIMGGSLVGIFSLAGVEECLKDTHSGRSKLVVCLFQTRMK
jgi:hypothetical protein